MGGFADWWRQVAEAFQYDFMVHGTAAALLVSPLLGGLSHLVVTKTRPTPISLLAAVFLPSQVYQRRE